MTFGHRTAAVLCTVSVLGVLGCAAEESVPESDSQPQEQTTPQESPEEEGSESGPADFVAPGGEGGGSLEAPCDLLKPTQLEQITGGGPYQQGQSDLDTIGDVPSADFATCQWETPENPADSVLLRIGSAAESGFLQGADDEPVEVAGAQEATINTELSRITWVHEDSVYLLSQNSREPGDTFDTEVFIQLAETVLSNHG